MKKVLAFLLVIGLAMSVGAAVKSKAKGASKPAAKKVAAKKALNPAEKYLVDSGLFDSLGFRITFKSNGTCQIMNMNSGKTTDKTWKLEGNNTLIIGTDTFIRKGDSGKFAQPTDATHILYSPNDVGGK